MKDVAEENRPRERLERQGVAVLSDAGLVAVLLGSGTAGKNVVEVAQQLLGRHELVRLARLSLKELQKLRGIGKARAMQLQAAFELGKRQKLQKNGAAIRSAKDVYRHVAPHMQEEVKECFIVLHLNAKNRVLKEETVAVGTLTAAVVHPREVFRAAMRESAHSIIVVHNHPSGDPSPSEEDRHITAALKHAGSFVGIPVLDYVIVGRKRYYSFEESGWK